MTANARDHASDGASQDVPSPCNSVCRMRADGAYCVGCYRTLEEIAGWSSFDNHRRRLILQELSQRRAQAT